VDRSFSLYQGAAKEKLKGNFVAVDPSGGEVLLLSGKWFRRANSFLFFFPKANGGTVCNSA